MADVHVHSPQTDIRCTLQIGQSCVTPDFVFKRHKYDLKIEPVEGPHRHLLVTKLQSPSIKISLVMWQALLNPKKHAETGKLHLQYSLPTAVDRAFRDRLLTTDHELYQGRSRQVLSDVLTPLALAIHEQMPACPPEDEWPEKPKSATPSEENPKLTDHQRETLTKWPTKLSDALPIGADAKVRGQWVGDRGQRATMRALLRVGACELGVAGIDIVDGKLKVVGDDVELVYRKTVLGGLLAGS